jgi:MraZ protein
MGRTGNKNRLRGSYIVKVDDGGRIKIPEEFRNIIETNYGKEVFVTSLNGEYVQVYPIKIWEKIEERIFNAPSTNPSVVKFIERTSYYGKTTQIDPKGRILIHPLLRQKSQLNGEVIILGSQNSLRIWNKTIFEKRRMEEPITIEDLKVLSEFGI